jgi:hypothetical protein
LLLQNPILSAKAQRTSKHAEVIRQRRIRTLPLLLTSISRDVKRASLKRFNFPQPPVDHWIE